MKEAIVAPKRSASGKRGEGSRVLGALGTVYGDLGTSPLYVVPAAFWIGHLALTETNVLGVISMIVWAVTLIVSIKYIGIMMRVDNEGEGGIMALIALLRRTLGKRSKRAARNWGMVGLVGVALFYGDSVITPAISVLSAAEGAQLIAPWLAAWTAPAAIVVLTVLFALQSRGTGKLGKLFSPIMIMWLTVSAAIGAVWIAQSPEILVALSPLTTLQFAIAHPAGAFIAVGAVVLSITGAEALYADMGHFGRNAIVKSWFGIVYPALLLNYLGQGAMLLKQDPSGSVLNTYFLMFPSWAVTPVVVLAMFATFVASQSAIAGAFSLTRQAVRLGFLPRLRIVHTSDEAGQIYIGGLNWLMYVVVVLLIVGFGTSTRLSGAFGMAVSGTLLASSVLLIVAAPYVWKRTWRLVRVLGMVFIAVEIVFVAANSTKFLHGAWVPIAIAASVLIVLTTWAKGNRIVAAHRRRREGLLADFLQKFRRRQDIVRIPGVAVYVSHHRGYTPLALWAGVDRLHELNESVIIVFASVENVPHITLSERGVVSNLGSDTDGIVEVTLRFGFEEIPNIPLALEHLRGSIAELDINLHEANYFISESDVIFSEHTHSPMGYLRGQLYTGLHRLSAPSPAYYRLPPGRTIDMAAYVEL